MLQFNSQSTRYAPPPSLGLNKNASQQRVGNQLAEIEKWTRSARNNIAYVLEYATKLSKGKGSTFIANFIFEREEKSFARSISRLRGLGASEESIQKLEQELADAFKP
jgi:hypothetical protein